MNLSSLSWQGPGDGASVVIVGAGPAGLVLGNLLLADGVDCLILERGDRERCERRARAGFLTANTVDVLAAHGLDSGLRAHGNAHDTYLFRGDYGEFALRCGELGDGLVHTVYPQQDLVRDLIAEFVGRGGDIRFETEVLDVQDVTCDRPSLRCRDAQGRTRTLTARHVAGCDGRHGPCRRAIPAKLTRRHWLDHRVSWLAVLARAPQSMPAVLYATHERGFAGHMARNAEITRYYLECDRADAPESWPAERVWAELAERMRVRQHTPLRQGPIIEQRVVDLRSEVVEPIQHGNLFLVGDAASLICPTAAKGANLAVMEADTLARALVAAVRKGDDGLLAAYSAHCLPRIWRAQEFSQWMSILLHGPHGDSDEARFGRALQRTRLENLRDSRAQQNSFAEAYLAI